MYELETPWSHWFFHSTDGGRALIADYAAAKGEEPLAGMEAGQITKAHPGNLSSGDNFGAHFQPVLYDSLGFQQEIRSSAALEGGDQPNDNTIVGHSDAWQESYARFLCGEIAAIPYHV